ncbi:MAG: DUF1501 domain-containing protein [Planctomycetaceae bacterium]|nr:DUF1501 domain-containing protein [Planctomycetaceae bacterium]
MLSFLGSPTICRRVTRRDVLQVGGLALGGLTLPALLRSQAVAKSASAARHKSVIMVWLRGAASHIDSWDMKPDAPPEIRGEFNPIPTSVPGIQVCEHMPRQAAMMDRLAIIRGIRGIDLGDHTPQFIVTGFPDRGKRPAFGSIVSRLQGSINGVPAFVANYDYHQRATYTGPSHEPFIPEGDGLENLRRNRDIPLERLGERSRLIGQFDSFRRDLDRSESAGSLDPFAVQALDMITSAKARDAFDLNQEPDANHERYGRYCESFLMARRLVEAGVRVVSVKVGDWDTHEKNFIDHKDQLPKLDQGIHALVTDLYDRGMQDDVAVVVWGEFGRAPRISRGDGRDHWPEAAAAVIAGGGFKAGQVIGETDRHAGESISTPYTPSNVLASLYAHMGIDTTQSLPDFSNRPMHVLDDRAPVHELT